jgi:hypothetical protein
MTIKVAILVQFLEMMSQTGKERDWWDKDVAIMKKNR